jgi:hypothetical protein
MSDRSILLLKGLSEDYQRIIMKKTLIKKFGIVFLCSLALAGVAGCASKDNQPAKTADQTSAFKGHKPTAAQLQAAMPKGTIAPPTSSPNSAPAPGSNP